LAKAKAKLPSPERQLDSFLAKFEPHVEEVARDTLVWMRTLTPGAMERVYDAYSALSIGFATGDTLRDTFIHVAVYPRHVNLGFNKGAALRDPRRVLVGAGSSIRHVRIDDRERLDDPYLADLVRAAATAAGYAKEDGADETRGPMRIVAVYARQRPRR
jgi:hypothetical protein